MMLIIMLWFAVGLMIMDSYWPHGFMWYEWKAWLAILAAFVPVIALFWAVATEETHWRM